ncbi:MAG: hypothetical protein Q4Q22_08145 [Methanosphaera sp.]|nr:hypothetical protein [Methanosphaera sp.]
MTGTEFAGNHAGTDGGAIYNIQGSLTLFGTEFTDNNAKYGGAIYSEEGSLTVIGTLFTDNQADYGGSIENRGTLIVTYTLFAGNHADIDGGAIENYGTLTVTGTHFTDNHAENNGGAIDNYCSILNVTDSQFNSNHADKYGGAIYNNQSTIKEFTNTLFYNNTLANFIINQTRNIQLVESDGYITPNKITLIVDGKEVLTNVDSKQLSTYTISRGNHLVKLIVNGTNTTNNEYIISDTIDVTGYQGLIDAIGMAQKTQYVNVIINLQPGKDYNATDNINWNNSATRNLTIKGNGVTLQRLLK